MNKILNKNILQIILGSMIFSIGIEWFAGPNKIVTGGATGTAIILVNILKLITKSDIFSIGLIVLVLNIPIFILSFCINGKKFVRKSIFATTLMTTWLEIFKRTPCLFKIENDIFLATILTGVLCGTGTGLILKAGASSGGSDMLANSINKLLPQFPIPKIIFTIDASIVLLGFLIFGASKTTYAIISIFISSKMINNILGGLRFARVVFIISQKIENISEEIFHVLGRGNTKISCTGMYTKQEKNLLIVIVMPKEIVKLKKIIEKNDEKAFVFISPAQEVLGNGFQN